MSNVDFIEQNEFHIKSRRRFGEPETPTMINILIKIGLVRNEKQALFVLLGFALVILLITGILINNRINPAGSDMIVDSQGNTYTFQEYIELVRQGKDPLLPR